MAKNQNIANTQIEKWSPFATTITATTTNPTGVSGTGISYYMQVGKMLFIKYKYTQSVAATTGGTGNYLFNLPGTFTINVTFMSSFVNLWNFGSIGTVAVNCVGGTTVNGVGICVPAVDASHYSFVMLNNSSGSTPMWNIVGPTTAIFNLSTFANICYSVSCAVPIN
jgi:hypothetical protein